MTTEIIDGEIGEHIDIAVSRVVALVLCDKQARQLNFNDHLIEITPETSVADAVDDYHNKVNEATRLWAASDEGKAYYAEKAQREAEEAARQAAGPVHDEQTMREQTVPTPSTLEDLTAYIQSLVNGTHSYGTCVYAMSMAAVAAFEFVGRQLGVTGFQASCADLDVLRRTRRIDGPFMLVKAQDALYPQYDMVESTEKFLGESKPWLKEQAQKLLESKDHTVERVKQHWKQLAEAQELPQYTKEQLVEFMEARDPRHDLTSFIGELLTFIRREDLQALCETVPGLLPAEEAEA